MLGYAADRIIYIYCEEVILAYERCHEASQVNAPWFICGGNKRKGGERMVTTPVMKGINPLMGLGTARQAGKLKEELSGSFSDAFSKATGQQSMQLQNMQARDNGVKQNTQVKQPGNAEQKAPDDGKAVNVRDSGSAQSSSKAEDVQTMEKVQGEADKAGQELVGEVAEELGVTEEEVISAMEMLGLTFADLLNVDNMTQLVLTLKDADMLTLMTDGGLYDSLQNLLGEVTQKLVQVGEAVDLPPEELDAVMEQLKQLEGQPEADAGTGVEADGKADPDVKTDGNMEWNGKDSSLPDGQEDYTVTVERNGEVVKVSVEVDGNAKTETAEVTNVKAEAPEEELVQPMKKEEGAKQENASSQGSSNNANILLDHLLNRESTAVQQPEASFENAMAARTADTQEIMNQIMNYMRVQVKADMTQMQLQLHPASLGTVNINIASKAGVITAQFLTQNEAVKAAVEGQIVQLKNQFEEQGIKVEAVEVAVESHAFERNLNEQGESRHTSQEGKKKGIRKLNLKDLDVEEEVMDEDDQLAVEMMRAGGGTVDFTA